MDPGHGYTYDLAAPQSNELDALGVFMIHHAVPLRGTTCGEAAALSTTVTDPVRAPDFVGVNFTEIVHHCPGASVPGFTQLLV